jgi:ArsR family transcriptional regulator
MDIETEVAPRFDACQGRRVSKQEHLIAELTDAVGCCSPLVREPLSGEQAAELAKVFKAMGDPVRLRLLSLIASHHGGEACVCDLTGVFDLTGPTISHHLKVLREAGLISGERRGTWVYYRVLPAALRQVSALVALDDAAL